MLDLQEFQGQRSGLQKDCHGNKELAVFKKYKCTVLWCKMQKHKYCVKNAETSCSILCAETSCSKYRFCAETKCRHYDQNAEMLIYMLKAETFTHVAIQSFTTWLSYCRAHSNSCQQTISNQLCCMSNHCSEN